MKYIVGKKEINVPEEEIEKLMDSLDISEDEAVQTWLFDNDYIENEEEAKLTKKAKDNRIMATIHEAKSDKPRAKRVVEKKEDVVKEDIIKRTAEMLAAIAENVKITNVSKIIEFDMPNGDHFKFDLVRQRKTKNK